MLFNSIQYLLFLPIVFAAYWLLRRRLALQNLFVVIASYVFYGWWDWRFLLLMAFTTLCSFGCGLLVSRLEARRLRRSVVTASLVINLGILVMFKYYDFFAGSFSELLSGFGLRPGFVTLDVVLPVGISFYTFQALGYVIDVYRRKVDATGDIVAFFAFISFFPQLVAGPIERSSNLLPQFLRPRCFDYAKAVDGLRQMLWGFFKKVVVADTCASAVDSIFIEAAHLDAVTLGYGAVLFSIQLYCDFSGYSDIAIGTGRLFGIDLMRNFNFPYFSRDIAEFWRRWHISLTTWFRDYVYIPLGGSRCGRWRSVRNTVVVFLLSGLWHGANWTFVSWGAYHALLFIPLLLTGTNRRHTSQVAEGRMLPTAGEAVSMAVTFALVAFGLIIFRSPDMADAVLYVRRMFTCFEPVLPAYGKQAAVWIVLLMAVEWVQRGKQHALQLEGVVGNRYLRYAIYYALAAIIVTFQGETAQFIYFQF